eukprot:1817873-Rhodomonas_salina.1
MVWPDVRVPGLRLSDSESRWGIERLSDKHDLARARGAPSLWHPGQPDSGTGTLSFTQARASSTSSHHGTATVPRVP